MAFSENGHQLSTLLSRLFMMSLLLCVFVFIALVWGDYDITWQEALGVVKAQLLGQETPIAMHRVIVWDIRIPRILLAVLVGASLGVSGVAYQGCFRNPLVEPSILGVSSGAAAGTALFILFPGFFLHAQLSAFFFALGAVLLSYFLGRQRGETPPLALVLSGIVVGSLFSALVGIMKYLAADDQLREITFWMMGGFFYASWEDVRLCASLFFPSLFIMGFASWRLNVLSLGGDEARSLGVKPERTRIFFILLATLLAAVSVSTVGIIAWVGLMMPHMARLLVGSDNRWLFPASALLGAAYLVLCDAVARNVTGAEIPVGIIASILGAPYLLFLVRSKGGELYGL